MYIKDAFPHRSGVPVYFVVNALKAPVLHNRLHKHTHESRARIRTLSFNVLNWIGQFWSKLDTLASRLIPHFTVTDALRRFDQILHTQCEA